MANSAKHLITFYVLKSLFFGFYDHYFCSKTYVITEVNGREEYEVFDLQLQPLDSSCNASNCSLSFLGSGTCRWQAS